MGDRESPQAVDVGRTAEAALASRKRAAIELIRRHERALRRTARRYSLCADDAEDALQRALEILLTKAPTSDQQELIRWMQTVTKHEALAVRRNRERSLGTPVSSGRDDDWVQLIPSERDGPADAAERRERVGRAREALKALKPQELRALTLLAEGYSYAEIGELTGWTYTIDQPGHRGPVGEGGEVASLPARVVPAALSGRRLSCGGPG
jgi:RNA polymerase sigma factor (sigma-70 family)